MLVKHQYTIPKRPSSRLSRSPGGREWQPTPACLEVPWTEGLVLVLGPQGLDMTERNTSPHLRLREQRQHLCYSFLRNLYLVEGVLLRQRTLEILGIRKTHRRVNQLKVRQMGFCMAWFGPRLTTTPRPAPGWVSPHTESLLIRI